MRTLLLLSAVFSLLAVYLECNPLRTCAPTAHTASATVVRDRHATVEAAADFSREENPAQHKPTVASADRAADNDDTVHLPLNLQLPGVESIQHSLDTGKSALIDIFKRRNQHKVTYKAELVYDQQTGEDITGGKVNIRIPLT